jgi:hypothetical protein
MNIKRMAWLLLVAITLLAAPSINTAAFDGTSPVGPWVAVDGTSPVGPWAVLDGTSPVGPWSAMDGTSPVGPWAS